MRAKFESETPLADMPLKLLEHAAPDPVTPERVRESLESGGNVKVGCVVAVERVDGQSRVDVVLDALRFVMDDRVARQIRDGMNQMDAQEVLEIGHGRPSRRARGVESWKAIA